MTAAAGRGTIGTMAEGGSCGSCETGGTVETLIDGHARNRGTNGNSVPCHGTGRLEKQIAEFLWQRART